jgi:hypothetical protein
MSYDHSLLGDVGDAGELFKTGGLGGSSRTSIALVMKSLRSMELGCCIIFCALCKCSKASIFLLA